MKIETASGAHWMRPDEPTQIPGGMDTGPEPFDFIKAGLGACTAMTIRMVAEKHKYKLDTCRVEIDHHVEGEGDDAYDVFTRRLVMKGNLSPDERQFY